MGFGPPHMASMITRRMRTRSLHAVGIAFLAASGMALTGCGGADDVAADAPAAQNPGAEAPEVSDDGGENESDDSEPSDDGAEDDATSGGSADGEDEQDSDADDSEGDQTESGSDDAEDNAEGADFFAPGAPVNADDYKYVYPSESDPEQVKYSFAVEGGDLKCTIIEASDSDMLMAGCHGTLPDSLKADSPEGDEGEEVPADLVIMETETGKEPYPEATTEGWILPRDPKTGDFVTDLKPLKSGESIVVGDVSCGALGDGAVACFNKEQSFTLSAENFTTEKNPRA